MLLVVKRPHGRDRYQRFVPQSITPLGYWPFNARSGLARSSKVMVDCAGPGVAVGGGGGVLVGVEVRVDVDVAATTEVRVGVGVGVRVAVGEAVAEALGVGG